MYNATQIISGVAKLAGKRKKIIVGLAFFCIGAMPAKASPFRQNHKHGLNATMVEQQNCIYEAFKNGAIGRKQFVKLQYQQAHIAHDIQMAKADGVVTREEKFVIRKEQAKAAHSIVRSKFKHSNRGALMPRVSHP